MVVADYEAIFNDNIHCICLFSGCVFDGHFMISEDTSSIFDERSVSSVYDVMIAKYN